MKLALFDYKSVGAGAVTAGTMCPQSAWQATPGLWQYHMRCPCTTKPPAAKAAAAAAAAGDGPAPLVLSGCGSAWGWAFLLATGLAAAGYLGGGVAYSRFVIKTDQLLLHKAQWVELAALCRDGVAFAGAHVLQGRGGTAGMKASLIAEAAAGGADPVGAAAAPSAGAEPARGSGSSDDDDGDQ